MSNVEYVFVHKNGAWWLKINTVEELFNYHDKTESKWSKTFSNLIDSVEFGRGKTHADATAYAVGFYGSNKHMGPIEAIQSFRSNIIDDQLQALLNYGEIYINQKGGYHFKYNEKDTYDQWVRRKELVFPDFKKDEIKIERFPGGTHFYAYVGDMQIRDGDILKWDTYEEAYKKAEAVINKK